MGLLSTGRFRWEPGARRSNELVCEDYYPVALVVPDWWPPETGLDVLGRVRLASGEPELRPMPVIDWLGEPLYVAGESMVPGHMIPLPPDLHSIPLLTLEIEGDHDGPAIEAGGVAGELRVVLESRKS